jgi:hypothetical protein
MTVPTSSKETKHKKKHQTKSNNGDEGKNMMWNADHGEEEVEVIKKYYFEEKYNRNSPKKSTQIGTRKRHNQTDTKMENSLKDR